MTSPFHHRSAREVLRNGRGLLSGLPGRQRVALWIPFRQRHKPQVARRHREAPLLKTSGWYDRSTRSRLTIMRSPSWRFSGAARLVPTSCRVYEDGIHLTVAHKWEWSYGVKPDNKTVPLPCYLESPCSGPTSRTPFKVVQSPLRLGAFNDQTVSLIYC